MVGKLALNSTHFTRRLVKYVPGRSYFRAVPFQNGDKFATSPTPPIVERLKTDVQTLRSGVYGCVQAAPHSRCDKQRSVAFRLYSLNEDIEVTRGEDVFSTPSPEEGLRVFLKICYKEHTINRVDVGETHRDRSTTLETKVHVTKRKLPYEC